METKSARLWNCICVGIGIGATLGALGGSLIGASFCAFPDPDIPCTVWTFGGSIVVVMLGGAFGSVPVAILVGLIMVLLPSKSAHSPMSKTGSIRRS
jgi:hypothetical protein